MAGSVCRRAGIFGADAEDFVSEVRVALMENDYATLRLYEGRSSLGTFLTVVIQRFLIDDRIRKGGRWRPSREAERLGEAGIVGVIGVEVDIRSAPALEVRPIQGEGLLTIPLRAGAVITISNIPRHGDPEQDHDADFLLHFLVTGAVPDHASFPEEPMQCAEELRTDNYPGGGTKFYTGPGCSNSNYP